MPRNGNWGLRSLAWVWLAGVFCEYGQALPTTRVQDILFNADDSRATGSVVISWQSFTASDGASVVSNSTTVRIVDGLLKVDLVPNENATPEGTSYQTTYLLDNGNRHTEHWVVPDSASPVTVGEVRVSPAPSPGVVILQSQVQGLVAALDSKADLNEENTFQGQQAVRKNSGQATALLSLEDETGSNFVGFRIPGLSGSTTYTLPGGDGLPNQQLTTDGVGNLFWAEGAGVGAGPTYEIFQDSGVSVTQRTAANFSNGLTVSDNGAQARTEVQPVFGSTAGTIAEGNDPRLSDARQPLAHASTHASAGSDSLTPGDIGALKNVNDTMTSVATDQTPLNVQGALGQTAPLQTWRDGDGTLMALISPQGSSFVREMSVNSESGGTVANLILQVDGVNRFAFSAFDTTLNLGRYDDLGVFNDVALQVLREGDTLVNTSLVVNDPTAGTGETKVTVKAGAGQGATALQEWQDNAGSVLTRIDAAGNLELNGHYAEFAEIAAPSQPAANHVRLFLDQTTGKLSVEKADATVSPLVEGGSPIVSTAVFMAGVVQAGIASTGFSLPAANFPALSDSSSGGFLVASLAFDQDADESVQASTTLPSDWTGDLDAQITWFGSLTTGSVTWALRTACLAAGEGISDLSFNPTKIDVSAAAAVASDWVVATIPDVPVTNCAAGEYTIVELFRDANASEVGAADDYAADVQVVSLQLAMERSL